MTSTRSAQGKVPGRRTLCAAAVVFLACAVPAVASTPSLDASVGALLRTASHNTALRALREFSGPHGLTGVEYENTTNGSKAVAWLTPDKQAVIPGDVFDAAGVNLTHQAEIEVGLRLTPAAARTAAAAGETHAITLGSRGPIITAFFDPNCPFCHALYESLQPAVEAGKVRVRYVLVGVVRPDSASRAASILAAAKPVQALAQNESGFNAANEQGGYPVSAATVYQPLMPVVDQNNKTMTKAGGVGTPTLVYCSAKTHAFVMQPGALSAAALLSDVADESDCPAR